MPIRRHPELPRHLPVAGPASIISAAAIRTRSRRRDQRGNHPCRMMRAPPPRRRIRA